jgi:hypothetical protein
MLALLAMFLVVLLGSISPAYAQSVFYVRAGATGAGNGSDWQNAYPTLPATLVRGATYYIADGTYPSYTFRTPNAGTSLITLRKATGADHGTDIGWNSTFGDGQAVFGSFDLITGYLTIDGAKRNESNWQDVASYGFKFPANGFTASASNGSSASNITIRYSDIGGPVGSVCGQSGVPAGSTAFYVVGSSALSNWVVSRNHIHHTEIPFLITEADNWTVEYNHIGPSWQKETISGQGTSGWVVRHNKFIDNLIFPPAACQHGGDGATADIGIRTSSTENNNWEIYGNVFGDTGLYPNINRSGAIIQGNCWNDNATSPTVSGWKVYNNTFYNIHGNWARILICGSNNVAVNNLWYRAGDPSTRFEISGAGLTGQTSWCYNDLPGSPANLCSAISGTKVLGSENPFVDVERLDFRLKASFSGPSPVNAGTPLGTGFSNVDAFGNIRGADGGWDIGAYERVADGGSNAPPSAPSALSLQ